MSRGIGLFAALSAACMAVELGRPLTIDSMHRVPVYPDYKKLAPAGPITDSTRETKRAKRRRLRREGKVDGR